jgi:aryl-alcohol dehydrogenase-like predicted oxidoreductase
VALPAEPDLATPSTGSGPLGATGATISPIGLGTWALGGPRWGAIDDAVSVRTIRHAVDAGVDWIDTAAIYGLGHAERLVAQALAPLPVSDRPLVFTKGGLRYDPASDSGRRVGSPAFLRADCDGSRRRLGVERLDVYLLHWPPEDGTPLEAAWDTLAELADAGKVRWVGLSNATVDQLERCARTRHVDAVQPPLSLLTRAAAGDVVPWAREHGAATIAYGPLASGLLAGQWSAASIAALDPSDWRRRRPEFSAPELEPALALVDALRGIAARAGCSLVELAIAWVLQWPGVTGAIVGVCTPEQLDRVLAASRRRLPPAVTEEIARALESTGAGSGPCRP